MPRLDLHDPKCELRVRPMYGLSCSCGLVDKEREDRERKERAKKETD